MDKLTIVDFAVISILQEEFEALLARMPPVQTISGFNGREVSLTTIYGADRPRTIALIRGVEQGTGEAQSLASDLLRTVDPAWVALVGIAGGRPDESFSLGDVVLGTHVHDFTVKAEQPGNEIEFSIKGRPIAQEVQGYISSLGARLTEIEGWDSAAAIGVSAPLLDLKSLEMIGPEDWQVEIRNSLETNFGNGARAPRFVDGEIASADDLLKDPEKLIPRLRVARKTKAVEMELAGIVRAVGKPLLVVKGISDIVGLKRKDSWKYYACSTAASLAVAILRTCPIHKGRATPSVLAGKPLEPRRELPSLMTAKGILSRLRLQARQIEERPRRKNILKVSRDELEIMIGDARADAREATVSLCGDLSWLPRDLERLSALSVSRPHVKSTIFYESQALSKESATLLDTLEELNLDFRPYPARLTRLKALLVDPGKEGQRALIFKRIRRGSKLPGEKPTEFHLRLVKENDWVVIESLRAVVSALEFAESPPFVVGVIGVNNVGKTRLVLKIREKLRSRGFRAVDVVEDVFKGAAAVSTIEENVALLWRQRDSEDKPAPVTVRLLDRTVIDHLCFLSLRGGTQIAAQLSPLIKDRVEKYNLIVDVRRKDRDYSENTKHLKAAERAALRRLLDEFIRDSYLRPLEVETAADSQLESIEAAAERIADEIRERLLVHPDRWRDFR